MNERKEIAITIPPKTIITLVLTILSLWLVYLIRDIILLFIFVIVVVTALSPIVRSWQKHMPRPLAIALVFLIIAVVILGAVSLLVPPLATESYNLILYLQNNYGLSANLRSALGTLKHDIAAISAGNIEQGAFNIFQQFSGSLGAVYSTTVSVVSVAVSVVTILVVSIYLLLDEDRTRDMLVSVLPLRQRDRIAGIVHKISVRIGDWLRGLIFVMAVVGVLSGVGMALLGVPYALTLGVWAGVTEIIPIIGPFIGAIPGVLLAFTFLGPIQGVIAIVIYFVIQEAEGHILVPKVIGSSVGVSPVTVIFGLLVGAKLFGLAGVFLSVPVVAALGVLYRELDTTSAIKREVRHSSNDS